MSEEKASSNRTIDYRCTRCKTETPPEDLRIKRATFATMKGKTIRTRTVSWLCPACLAVDVQYNLPARATSPGMADTKLARRLDGES